MSQKNEYCMAKYACYMSNISGAVIFSLSPILFVTFREMYGFSYTLLGLLVVMNFSTQLTIDLIFTFFAKRFNIHKTLKAMPLITMIGLLVYAIMPSLIPSAAYLWIALGTVIFSVSAGLGEVLISPVIAAIPSDNPDREMSKLHSTYAWGVVAVVIVSAVFLKLFGTESWQYMAIFWTLVPLSASILFKKAKLPEMSVGGSTGANSKIGLGLALCIGCIFLGGAAECTMGQWVSSFVENVIGLPKLWGDIFGMAMFSALLGLGRSLYAKFGKNIINVMLLGMAGAFVCYLIACLSLNSAVGLIGCVMAGIFVSMLWPGTLICVGERFKNVGVAAYALLAAGGDLGASVAPQLVGIVADRVSAGAFAVRLAEKLSVNPEQIGIRAGILLAAVFPCLGIVIILCMKRYFKKAVR